MGKWWNSELPAGLIEGAAVFSCYDGLHVEGTGILHSLHATPEFLELRHPVLNTAMPFSDPDAVALFVQNLVLPDQTLLVMGIIKPTRDYSRRPGVFGCCVAFADIPDDLTGILNPLYRFTEDFVKFHDTHLLGQETKGRIGFLAAPRRIPKTGTPAIPSRSQFYHISDDINDQQAISAMVQLVYLQKRTSRIILLTRPAQGAQTLNCELVDDIATRFTQEKQREQELAAEAAASRARFASHGAQRQGHRATAVEGQQKPASSSGMLIGGLTDLSNGISTVAHCLKVGSAPGSMHPDLTSAQQKSAISQQATLRILKDASEQVDAMIQRLERPSGAGSVSLAQDGGRRGLADRSAEFSGLRVIIATLVALLCLSFLAVGYFLFHDSSTTSDMFEPSAIAPERPAADDTSIEPDRYNPQDRPPDPNRPFIDQGAGSETVDTDSTQEQTLPPVLDGTFAPSEPQAGSVRDDPLYGPGPN